MSNNIVTFTPPMGGNLRVIMKNGKPWFVAADVCAAIGVVNHRAATTNFDADEKGVALIDTLGGRQKMTVVSEGGLYALLLRSDDAVHPGTAAHGFRKWVTAEVLPSIRNTGQYAVAVVKQPKPAAVKRISGAQFREARNFVDYTLQLFPELSNASKQAFVVSVMDGIGISLPAPAVEKSYSTSELAAEFGMAPSVFGKLVKELKLPQFGDTRLSTASNGKQVEVWAWNEAGREAVYEAMRDDDDGDTEILSIGTKSGD